MKWAKAASFLLAVDIFATLAQTPVTLRMAENAGRELCAMARRGELQTWKWPDPMRGVVNDSPSLPKQLRKWAPLLARSCTVRVYPTISEAGIVLIHIRPESAKYRALMEELQGSDRWFPGGNEGLWIALHHSFLWTPLFDLLRSEPYGNRIEITGFGGWRWGLDYWCCRRDPQ